MTNRNICAFSPVSFKVFDNEKVDAIRMLFSNNNFAPYYSLNQNREFVLTVNEDMINSKKSMFEEIIKIRYKPLLSHR